MYHSSWSMVILMVGFFSWTFHRFIVPRQREEWLLGYGIWGVVIEAIVGIALVFAGLYVMDASRNEGFRTKEKHAFDGIYGIVRHPEYLGIFLVLLGQLVHWPTIVTLMLTPLIVLAYVWVSREEEKDLLKEIGGGI